MARNKKENIEGFVVDKKKELIWALSEQGYNTRQLSYVFGISRAGAHNIIQEMPSNWVSPWVKKK
jgi:hypothetical protein